MFIKPIIKKNEYKAKYKICEFLKSNIYTDKYLMQINSGKPKYL